MMDVIRKEKDEHASSFEHFRAVGLGYAQNELVCTTPDLKAKRL